MKEEARRKFLAAMSQTKPKAGTWLRLWRESHAFTQIELAKMLGISRSTLIRAELSDELPRVLVLALEGR